MKKTERQMALHRAGLHCGIGKDALNGNIADVGPERRMEFALYNLIGAVEAIAKALEEKP